MPFSRYFSTVESDVVERQERQIVQVPVELRRFLAVNHIICTEPADTHAFRAWRGQIQTAVGPYCAAGAAAAGDRTRSWSSRSRSNP